MPEAIEAATDAAVASDWSRLTPILEQLEKWDPVVTWLLVIAGWLVVWHQQSLFIQRQEIRQLLDRLLSQIESIDEAGDKYWALNGADGTAAPFARFIKRKVKLLNMEFEQASKRCSIGIPDGLREGYRKALTDGEFDSPTRAALVNTDERFMRIHLESNQLRACLEKAYGDSFPVSRAVKRRLRKAASKAK